MARRDRQRAVKGARLKAKAQARARDGNRCRWPDCRNCRDYKPRLESAHLVPLSRGGLDETSNLITLDYLTHQGPDSLHAQTRRVTPVTERGADGPCKFEELREEGWVTVHVEDGR